MLPIHLWFQSVQEEMLACEILNMMKEQMGRAGIQLNSYTHHDIVLCYFDVAIFHLEYEQLFGDSTFRNKIWIFVDDLVGKIKPF